MILSYNHDEAFTAEGLRNKLKGVPNSSNIYIVLDKDDDNYDEDGILRIVHPVTAIERETILTEFSDEPEKNIIFHLDDNFYEEYETVHKSRVSWHRVDKELPPMRERVIVYVPRERSMFISKRIPHDGTNPADERWHWANVVNDADVTMWHHLPLPPNSPRQ